MIARGHLRLQKRIKAEWTRQNVTDFVIKINIFSSLHRKRPSRTAFFFLFLFQFESALYTPLSHAECRFRLAITAAIYPPGGGLVAFVEQKIAWSPGLNSARYWLPPNSNENPRILGSCVDRDLSLHPKTLFLFLSLLSSLFFSTFIPVKRR